MDSVLLRPNGHIGRHFVPPEYLPPGKDEYYLRNAQSARPPTCWRNLRAEEVERLVKNNNTCDSWDDLLVTDEFHPGQIRNTDFFGLVRIGRLRPVILEHHDLQMPAGITDSIIVACDIGDDVAIHGVRYLAHYIIGDRCILANIDEMHTTNHAKFGNGVLKDGEPEQVRVWMDVINEAGCRRVLPFDGMISADAYLWAKYRDDAALQAKLIEITQKESDPRRGFYGVIGPQCVIKTCRILKDVKIGSHCYIKGANKLKNLTINSSEAEPSQIGEGVELVNGIIGYGCHIFYGCKAVRFVLGNNSHLKYGARLINSFLGDNSTISCCEVLNNLIFPSHEQHHNNSFLIASVVLGQSNIAAGATVGSNHNSRANDNEIEAGRGFWPGLCTSLKHSSRFASFTLLAKGDYPAELDIPLPFSLVNNDDANGRLEIMPAFWWLHDMYALARNGWKYHSRDQRVTKVQHIEYEALAPDTVEEILCARRLLRIWAGKARLRQEGADCANRAEDELARLGDALFAGPEADMRGLEVLGENMEKSHRPVVILKAHAGYRAYDEMLHYYAVKTLIAYLQGHPQATFSTMAKDVSGESQGNWVNLGGQLALASDVDRLRDDVGAGRLKSWRDIHGRYDELWRAYSHQKARHAFATLRAVLGAGELTTEHWLEALRKAVSIQEYIREQVYTSRKKDYDNSFRRATFRNEEEMKATVGTAEENGFVKQIAAETEQFKNIVADIAKRV